MWGYFLAHPETISNCDEDGEKQTINVPAREQNVLHISIVMFKKVEEEILDPHPESDENQNTNTSRG